MNAWKRAKTAVITFVYVTESMDTWRKALLMAAYYLDLPVARTTTWDSVNEDSAKIQWYTCECALVRIGGREKLNEVAEKCYEEL